MSSSKTLYLIRHGQTDHNLEGRFQGHLDIPLNETGRVQASELVHRLHGEQISAFVSSDLIRAVDTAQILKKALSEHATASEHITPHAPHIQHPGLREMHLGDAQGMLFPDIEAKFGKDIIQNLRDWHKSDTPNWRYPGGESPLELTTRVFAALEEIFHRPELAPHSNIAVVTHGGVLRRILFRILPRGSPGRPTPNVSVFKVTMGYLPEEKRFKYKLIENRKKS